MNLNIGNRKFLYIILSLAVFVVIAGSYIFYVNYNRSNPNGTQPSGVSPGGVPNTTTPNTGVVANVTVEDENPNSPYIKDKKIGSYIWFSGNRWLLIGKDTDSINLLSAEPIAILNYNFENNNSYELSYLRSWLNGKYYNTLNNKALIKPATYTWKIRDDGTSNQVSDNVGLLTKEDYLKNMSITKISKYFWTMSASLYNTSQVYLVTNTGALDIGSVDNKYGVRPVIKLSNVVSIRDGKGTKDSPYKLEQEFIARAGEKLNTRHSGEYLSYSNLIWRVVEANEDGTTKIISNTTFWYEGFDKRNIPVFYPDDKANIGYYLNNVIYNNLSNKEWIIPKAWYLKDFGYVPKGEPKPEDPEYNQYQSYKNRMQQMNTPGYVMPELTNEEVTYERELIEMITVPVGMPKIGDLLTASDINADWWLLTQPNGSISKLYYIYSLSGIISKADAFTNLPARPVINLDAGVYISSGDGSIESPYTIAK